MSEKRRKELHSCIAKVVGAIKKKLEDELDAQQSDVMARHFLHWLMGLHFISYINKSL